MMKIFVTGGGGFLGEKLCNRLLLDGHEVVAPNSKECNLLEEGSLRKFQDENYDQIFHLAAWTQAGDFCLKYPGDQWIKNQKINTNLLSWWSERQSQAKLIFMGTSCAYSTEYTLSEDNYLKGEPIESLYTYAMTKRMLLQGARALQIQKKLKWMCFVPSTLYGANYHLDGRQMHFIFDLIRKIINGKLYMSDVILWGNGYQKREIIHVEDFIDAVISINNRLENAVINIGAGEDKTIRQFAEIISKLVQYDHKKIIYDEKKYVGSNEKLLDIKKLEELIPAYRKNLRPLEDGILEVIRWFYENEKILKNKPDDLK